MVETVLPAMNCGSDFLNCASGRSRVAGVWKTVHVFVASDRNTNQVARYLRDHINAVAYEAGSYQRVAVGSSNRL
jgi:hypothetical protein